jgi:ABC-type nitrate/sulfonate/bicarbonate transport system substrate-binding protein
MHRTDNTFHPRLAPAARCTHSRWPAFALLLAALLSLAACVPVAAPNAPAQAPATASPPGGDLVIYAPATPSSVPVLLAVQRMNQDPALGRPVRVVIYTNQTQASSLFLRGDVPLLVTGLSVGVEFFKNKAPVQAVNSFVSGLTYLVTYGKPVSSFRELPGGQIYIPFQGSPIEEITRYFVEQEGLTWGRDVKPVYAPFVSSVELLKQGKAAAVALPEPYISLIEGQAPITVSFGYHDRWNALTGSKTGYPQVATFAHQDWAAAHPDLVARFNTELAAAIASIQRDPAAALADAVASAKGSTSGQDSGPAGAPVLTAPALARTTFAFTSGDAMAQDIRHYYQTIGKPLDESFNAFFTRGPRSSPQ